MALLAKAKGDSNFTPVSEGLHQAICSAVVDLGMQPGSDMYPKPKRQVYLRFDCVDEMIDYEKDGASLTGPARCGATYTLSLSDKSKLRPLLESWRGKKFSDAELEGFDVSRLLGAPCQIQVLHTHKKGNTYANVQTVVPWPKSTPKPTMPEDSVYFSAVDPACEPSLTVSKLPKWLREKWQGRVADTEEDLTPDVKAGTTQGDAQEDFDDSIPF